MLDRSLVQMVKGRLKEFSREPSALFFVVFMPILWMLVLGMAFSSSPNQKEKKIGLIETQDPLRVKIEEDFSTNKKIKLNIKSWEDLSVEVKRGHLNLIVEANNGQITYHFDPSNPQAYPTFLEVNQNIQEKFGRKDVIPSQIKELEIKNGRYIDFLIPGLLAFSLFTTSLFGTGMTIVSNRRENLLKRYLVTPMKPMNYILSHIFSRYIISFAEFLIVILFGMFVYDFHIDGSWIEFLILMLLGVSSFTAIGILCGSKTKNTSTYNGMINLLTFPMMLMGGVWFSREGFPPWMISISDFFPLTALVEGLRKIALEGKTLSSLYFEMGLLLAYTLIGSILSKKWFKWY